MMASQKHDIVSPAFQAAFTRLEATVTKEHARTFQNTDLKDIWTAVNEIEAHMSQRQSLRGLKRIEPFLKGIEQYAKVVEVLCNGTPYLPWLWAPVKLFIQIAMENLSAFDKLLEAYRLIGVTMPRFDKLSDAFREDAAFQDIVGQFYSNILEFHRTAYKYLCRRAWKIMFESLWKNFDSRFKSILESLRKAQQLVDQEAHTRDIVEARAFRTTQMEALRQWETERLKKVEDAERKQRRESLREAVSWVGSSHEQDEEFQEHLYRLTDRTCSTWITSIALLKEWFEEGGCRHPSIWLNGKPGAGKSVICSQIVDYIRSNMASPLAYCYCNLRHGVKNPLRDILQSLVAQLTINQEDLAIVVLDQYVYKGLQPTTKSLKEVLAMLVSSISPLRIIIDGIDEVEFSQDDQREILRTVLRLQSHGNHCKILISSRELTPFVSGELRNASSLCLENYPEHMSQSIASFVERNNDIVKDRFGGGIADKVKRILVANANGMFLWVRLVHDLLLGMYSAQDVTESLKALPPDLETLYFKIVTKICGEGSNANQRTAIKILQWLISAPRSLKRSELECGIVLDERTTQLTPETMIRGNVLELCSPLIDMSSAARGVVSLIHFTALEYLRKNPPTALLSPCRSNFAVLLSTSLYLSYAYTLLDNKKPYHVKAKEVLQGQHDLHVYANENFDYHLKQYCTHDRPSIETRMLQKLAKAIEQMAEYRQHFTCVEGYQIQQSVKDRSKESHEEMFDCLPVSSKAKHFLLDVTTFRLKQRDFEREVHKHGETETFNSSHDPSLLFKLKTTFLDILENLLINPSCCTNGDAKVVSDFKVRNASGGFLCRSRLCEKSVRGFDNQSDRDQHEQSHNVRYKCTEANCPQREWTFSSKRSLVSHRKQYHDLLPPAFLHQRDRASISNALIKPLDEIPDLPYLFQVYGHDWPAIARNISAPLDPKTPDEVENYYYERLEHLRTADKTEGAAELDGSSTDDSNRNTLDILGDASSIRLVDLDLEDVSESYKKIEQYWTVVFNPHVEREFDIDLVHTLPHGTMVTSIDFSLDGLYMATGSARGASIFESRGGSLINTFVHNPAEPTDNFLRDVKLSPDGNLLVVGDDDCIVRVWDIVNEKVLCELRGHQSTVCAVDFARNGSLIASGSMDRSMKLWDATSGTLRRTVYVERMVTDVSISHDSALVAATAFRDNGVRVWNTTTGQLIFESKEDSNEDVICSVDFDLQGYLFSSALDSKVKKWALDPYWPGHTESDRCVRTFEGHNVTVSCTTTVPEDPGLGSKWLLSCDNHGDIMIWNTQTGVAHAYIRVRNAPLFAKVAASLGSKSTSGTETTCLFATCGFDRTAEIWKLVERR